MVETGLVKPAVRSVLGPLMERREAIAADLARQVAYASRRTDTEHPAFKGCVDWHSAVHGAWALTAYQRATADTQYAPLLASILEADALAREREHLRREPLFEMPYGRAWFLRLAIDHHRLTSTEDLLPLADEVAASLRDYYRGRVIDRFSGEYRSCSWALINLLDYARHRKHQELEAELTTWVTKAFVEVDRICLPGHERGEFMAVCTNWAALVARVLDDEYSTWLEEFIAGNGLPSPLARPRGDHEYGLNFSRAWGLWDMYAATGRQDALEAYVAHVEHGLKPASNWRGRYRAVGHWVAQFGLFALQPLFGPEAGR